MFYTESNKMLSDGCNGTKKMENKNKLEIMEIEEVKIRKVRMNVFKCLNYTSKML